mgnify:CR=1 FL=1
MVTAHPEVNHNYEREHQFDLWFTLAVPPLRDMEGDKLLLPAAADFELKNQVKSVITVVAKVHHYWEIHAVVYGVE